jgi:hypothetical protein
MRRGEARYAAILEGATPASMGDMIDCLTTLQGTYREMPVF